MATRTIIQQPVESSFIVSIGHDGIDTMEVVMKGNRRYTYPNVSVDDFEALKNAESIGKHLRTMGTGKRVEEEED